MGALDQIRQMREEGLSEQEISNRLQEQGINPSSITDAFSQAKIKEIVEGEREMQENDFTSMEIPLESETPSPFSSPAPEVYDSSIQEQSPQYYSPQESSYSQPLHKKQNLTILKKDMKIRRQDLEQII